MTAEQCRTALWVVPVGEFAGVARHVVDVAEVGLPGWELVVLCPEGALAARLRDVGTTVITGALGPAAGLRSSLATVRRTIRSVAPGLVHSHLSYADVVCAMAAAGTGTRVVTTEHGIAADDIVYHGSRAKARAKAVMHRLRLRRTDLVLAVSEATRNTMVAKWHPRQPIVVVPNGVDPDEVGSRIGTREPAEPGVGPRVLSLARLSAEKRISELLAAFAILVRTRPGATLVVAGDGPDRAALAQRTEDLGLAGRVQFPGFVDSGEAMAAADVVVQLSVWENCSYTLLDASSAGLAVVATPVGGNPEILPPPCLVEADDAEAVAATILAQVAAARPPWRWPTRSDMTRQITAEYDRLCP